MPALTVPGSLKWVDGSDRVSVITCNYSMLPRTRFRRTG